MIYEIQDKRIGRTIVGIVLENHLFILYNDGHVNEMVVYDKKRYEVGDEISDWPQYLAEHCAKITEYTTAGIDVLFEKMIRNHDPHVAEAKIYVLIHEAGGDLPPVYYTGYHKAPSGKIRANWSTKLLDAKTFQSSKDVIGILGMKNNGRFYGADPLDVWTMIPCKITRST